MQQMLPGAFAGFCLVATSIVSASAGSVVRQTHFRSDSSNTSAPPDGKANIETTLSSISVKAPRAPKTTIANLRASKPNGAILPSDTHLSPSRAQEVPSEYFLRLHPNAFRFWGRFAATLIENDELLSPSVNPPASGSEPYHLKDASRGSYSQHRQDMILLPILSQIKNGFFVESGALDGELHSNTLMYEMSHHWTGLLVEPDPRYVPDLKAKHRRAYLYDGCLSPSDTAMKIAFDVHDVPGWSKISPSGSHVAQAQPLHVLLQTIGRDVVDFWSLDIEGSEGLVLQHTDFSKFEVGILLIETNKSRENNMVIDATLKKNGFVKVGAILGGLDTLYANPAYFKKRNLPFPTLTMLGQ